MPFASEQGHGLKGLDLSHLVDEISRLALSNQRFGVSTQTIELSKHRKGSGPGGGSATVTDLDDAKATGVGGRLNDWSSFCGRSPVYSIITTSAYPSFSQLDLVILIEI